MTKNDDRLGYDRLYEAFETPLVKKVRAAAYARDIGQHSWVDPEELNAAAPLLRLSPGSHLLDLGCGPGGPLSFLAKETGCSGVGIDLSATAVTAARERAVKLGLDKALEFQQGDLNEALPFSSHRFDAVMSLDVILHVRDRHFTFKEVARVLMPGGRFFFTDAGVETGAMSEEERRLRASTAPMTFVSDDFNLRTLEAAGFRLITSHDSTQNVLTVVNGRLSARAAHKGELQEQEGRDVFTRQQLYLEAVKAVSEKRALSRISYVAEAI